MSGWTKVKEIFARETNSVSVTAKLGVAVDTETEAYKQGFDKDKGKILANQIGKEGKVERVWQDAKLFGDSLANQTASDINFVTLRNYVAYLKASNQNVSEKLLNDFRNGGTNVKAIEKLEKLGQIVGVDVWTGNDVQTKDTNNDKGAIKQIYKESLQGAIKSVVSECVSKHAEDVFGILKRFIPSENQEKAVEMLKGLSTKTPDEQRRIIVEVIYTCITKEGLRATNVGEKSVRIQAIESIFENKSTQSAQATNEQVAKVIEKAPAEIKKEIKKDGGKVLPSESLTKYLGSLGIIVDSKGNCESATREQAEKIKIMLKDTKKPLSEKDRLFLEALIIRHTGELDTRVNKDTSRNAGYIGSAPVLEEALKKTDRVADASRKQTDANSAARNLENYIEKRRINPRNNREMEILSDDPVFKTLTKEVKRTNQVRKRATEDYPELDSFFSNTSLLNSSSVLSGQKWDAALGRE